MKGLKFVAILMVMVFIGVAACACAPEAPPTTPPPTTPPPTTPPAGPAGFKTVTGTEADREFSISYPEDWSVDNAAKSARSPDWDQVSMAGYTVAGGCYAYFKSPDGNAHVEVCMTEAPLPITVDRVFGSKPFPLFFANYAEISFDMIEGTKKLKAIHIFTYDGGKVKQLMAIDVGLPGQWQVSCIAKTDAAYAQYESQFDAILNSFAIE